MTNFLIFITGGISSIVIYYLYEIIKNYILYLFQKRKEQKQKLKDMLDSFTGSIIKLTNNNIKYEDRMLALEYEIKDLKKKLGSKK